MKLALLIANRGFFPSSVIESARADMHEAALRCGITLIEPNRELTRYGAVESTEEGVQYAAFLDANRGAFDGIIVSLPNFGDENGIKAAIRDANVPMLLQAYPDEIGRMDFANRRDAFCGKLGLSAVLKQMDYRYTSGQPFTMHPLSAEFERELADFAAICRVVKGMRKTRMGCFGARTTAFKSVRYDEIALERSGVEVETFDLSHLFECVRGISEAEPGVGEWVEKLSQTMCLDGAPAYARGALGRLGVALDEYVREYALDAFAIRCWSELQAELKITPCSVLGVFNQAGVSAACETDVMGAVAMRALALASGRPSGCLDLNNNYGSDPDKLILFHCGPLPIDLMAEPGRIEEHKMFVKTQGENCSWGLNVGRIRPGAITLSGMRTERGAVEYYVEEAEITDDPVENAFFRHPGRDAPERASAETSAHGGGRIPASRGHHARTLRARGRGGAVQVPGIQEDRTVTEPD